LNGHFEFAVFQLVSLPFLFFSYITDFFFFLMFSFFSVAQSPVRFFFTEPPPPSTVRSTENGQQVSGRQFRPPRPLATFFLPGFGFVLSFF